VRRRVHELRVCANLVDVGQERTIWAERYDGGGDDPFEFQDRIASGIVATIEPRLFDARAAARNLLALDPSFRISALAERYPLRRPGDLKRYTGGCGRLACPNRRRAHRAAFVRNGLGPAARGFKPTASAAADRARRAASRRRG